MLLRILIIIFVLLLPSGCFSGLALGAFSVLEAGAFVAGPFMTQVPNSGCYIIRENHEQGRSCKPEETR